LICNAKELIPNECNEYPDLIEELSSVNVWRGVGEAIVNGDMEAADIRKTEVEEKQRILRQQRSENGEEFVPKYFHIEDPSDGWPFWTINNKDWFLDDPSQISREKH